MYKRVLTIQDISCLGQCSLTVALPIISACASECACLPTAVLSTHTGGFSGYTFCDLTEEMGKIASHWQQQQINFDCIYTGYMGSLEQVDVISSLFDSLGDNAIKVVDPVMADKGKLYAGFTPKFVTRMSVLLAKADVIVPNITEACFLLDKPYIEKGYDNHYIEGICRDFSSLTNAKVVLTGVSFADDKLGVAVYEGGKVNYYIHDKIPVSMHGTGDVYASALVGALMQGNSLYASACVAADYTVECIKATIDDTAHWYGVKFEKALPYLIKRLSEVK